MWRANKDGHSPHNTHMKFADKHHLVNRAGRLHPQAAQAKRHGAAYPRYARNFSQSYTVPQHSHDASTKEHEDSGNKAIKRVQDGVNAKALLLAEVERDSQNLVIRRSELEGVVKKETLRLIQIEAERAGAQVEVAAAEAALRGQDAAEIVVVAKQTRLSFALQGKKDQEVSSACNLCR